MSISCFGDAVNKQIRTKAIEEIISTVDFINDESKQKTQEALLSSKLTIKQIRETYEHIAKMLREAKDVKLALPYR